MSTQTNPLLISGLPAGRRSLAMGVLLAIAGSLLLTLSAKVQVPFQPVPMTLQTLAVMGIGLLYGRNLAFATVALYLLQGAAGLPVFAETPAKGIGLAYMLGGTGGYLLGFLIAATVCGWLGEYGWGRRFHTAAAALLIGASLIYLPGMAWLGALYGWDKPLLAWGLWPFLPGELTKLAIGAVLVPALWSGLDWLKARR